MTTTTQARPQPGPLIGLQLLRHVEPLRVLHVVPALHAGGMERSLLRLLEGFADRREDECETAAVHGVCVLQDGDADLLARCRSVAGTWVLGERGDRVSRGGAWRGLREVIAFFGPDVVHARTTGAWLDAALAVRRLDARLLLSFHGRSSLERPGWLRRLVHRWACRQADGVMAVSFEAGRMLHHDWGVPAYKIHVLGNGVDTERFHPAEHGHRESDTDVPPRGPADHVVICVANLLPIKALDTLLRTWRQVVMADPQAKLWVVGDGPLRESLEQLIREARIADSVVLLGRRADVPELLRAADLFVLPSRYEASSNAALEAMATGLPVVAYDVGGMSEIVRPNHTGWLVTPDEPDRLAETILGALMDRATRLRIGQAARRAAIQEHNLAEWLDRYAVLYRRLAEGGAWACAE